MPGLADTGWGLLIAGGNFLTMSGQSRNGLAGFQIPPIDFIFVDGLDGKD